MSSYFCLQKNFLNLGHDGQWTFKSSTDFQVNAAVNVDLEDLASLDYNNAVQKARQIKKKKQTTTVC